MCIRDRFTADRKRGYQAAMAAAGLPFHAEDCIEMHALDMQDAALHALIEREDRPTAIVVSDDILAVTLERLCTCLLYTSYIGAEGEENQGLCTGTENYWCVNNAAKQEDIDATLAFMNWVITSDEGRKSMSQDMGFVAPFDTFTGEYQSANPVSYTHLDVYKRQAIHSTRTFA